MKSFLEWFKSSAKVKRWMFLIIIRNGVGVLWVFKSVGNRGNEF